MMALATAVLPLAVVAASAVGVIDECIQKFIPSRVFALEDILFNVGAASMAIGASVSLRWARGLAARKLLA